MNRRGISLLPLALTTLGALLGCVSADSQSDGQGDSSGPVPARLDPHVRGELVERLGADAPVILVVLRGTDCFTCDQLGRRLREFARSAPRHYDWVVITDTAGASRTRGYLKRERIRFEVLLSLDSLIVFEGARRETPTPAVVVASTPVAIFDGIAPLGDGVDANLRSLARELGFDASVDPRESGQDR